jgi:tetratricopeptide (TPR) repeat protein
MAKVHPIAAKARSLRLAQKHQAAIAALKEGLEKEPGHPDLLIEQGLLFCLLQKEDVAVEMLEMGAASPLASELGLWLARYYHCRSLMACRLGLADAKSRSLQKRVAKVYSQPLGDAGIAISACLIVKNEEKHLERCLSSLKDRVDEIVVVDTGSTDRTIEIAQSFGATVAVFDWCDDFSAARNVGLELATGNWALWIDADEELAPESWGPIQEALIRPHFGGYFIKIVNFMDEEGDANTYTHAPVRLFQLRPEVRFSGRVHEQVTPALDALDLPCAHLNGATIYHYGYRPSDMAEKGKLDRTVSLLEKEVRESPGDAFHWFNLANAYSVGRRPDDAIHAARMCIRHIHPENAFGTLAYQILASALNQVGKPHEALEACEEAEQKGFFTILNQFELAHALFKLVRYEEALQAIERCMAMPWDESMTGDYGIVTHKARTLRGQILGELERFEEALADLEAALEVDPNFPVAIFGKAVVLERTGNPEAALALYEQLFDDVQFDLPARECAVRVATSVKDYLKAAIIGEANSKAHPLQLSAWAGWLGALEAIGEPHRRQAAYQAFAEFHDPSADVLVNWSRALRECGEIEGAYDKLHEAVEREPQNANAHFNLGDLLYASGLFADAAGCYEAGLRLHPDSAEGWFVLGNCFAQLGVWEGARLAYLQAMELKPNYKEARHNLALVDESAKKAA